MTVWGNWGNCPGCGKPFRGHTEVGSPDAEIWPKPGDVTICAGCVRFLVVAPEGDHLRLAEEEDLPPPGTIMRDVLQRAVSVLEDYKREHPDAKL